MQVFRMIGQQRFVAEAPDGAMYMGLGPMPDRDLVIVEINYKTRTYHCQGESAGRPFPAKIFTNADLNWRPYPEANDIN